MTTGETILLLEDEEGVRRLLTTILEGTGYRVLQAPAASGAIDLAQSHQGPLHLLITDVTMPDMDGRDVARQVTSLRPDCRVLFISGYPATVAGAVDDRSVAFLQKPFVPRMLVQRVRQLLAHPE